jgi:hypothetical protein
MSTVVVNVCSTLFIGLSAYLLIALFIMGQTMFGLEEDSIYRPGFGTYPFFCKLQFAGRGKEHGESAPKAHSLRHSVSGDKAATLVQ